MKAINKLKQIQWINFKINWVYTPYRFAWDEAEKKYRSFYKFPLTEDEVLINWTWRIEEVKSIGTEWKYEWREKLFIEEEKAYGFKKSNIKDLYKRFRKVFDIDIVLENPTEVEYYENWWIITSIEQELKLKAFPATRLKKMLKVLCPKEKPNLIDWKDKAWKPAKVPEFDYEDKMKDLLVWKFCEFTVDWEWMDTEYTFIPWKEFSVADLEDIISNKSPKKHSFKQQEDISIEDIPFN